MDDLFLHVDGANVRSYPGTGTSWYDMSTNLYSGSFTGGPVYSLEGAGGIQFDGVDDYIDFGTTFFNFTNGFTIEAWVKPTAYQTWSRILDFGTTGLVYTISLGMTNTTPARWFFTVRSGFGVGLNAYLGTDGISLNSVQCVTFTLSPSGGPGTVGDLFGYLNGVNLDLDPTNPSSAQSMRIPDAVSRTSSLIGKSNFAGDAYYQGSIYSIKIYNRFFSATEIERNYDAMKTRFGLI
jgi:hypothetical protein